MAGLFITFEGIDGSGKSTQISLLKDYLTKKGFSVTLVREPGSTKLSETIRNILLDINNSDINCISEALLYAASRAQLVNNVILPTLKNGDIVLCDRFVDSSIVYQGFARGIGEADIIKINNIATSGLKPDLTIFLNISPKDAINRKKLNSSLDRIESEKQNFYNQVYNGYIKLAKKDRKRIKTINASDNIDLVHQNIIIEVENLFLNGFKLK